MMKTIKAFSTAAAACVVAAIVCSASQAWAQPGDAMAASAASAALSPKAARQANRALQKKIYAAIAKDKAIDAGSISIKANGGAVAVNGTVTEAAQIDQVNEIVKSVAGVTSVTTKLSVQRPLGQ